MVLILHENQSARVEHHAGGITIHRENVPADEFVRLFPRWTPVKVFSTGLSIEEGRPDPHWQLVARSDDPGFKPQAAMVVTLSNRAYEKNAPARSQWISIGSKLPKVPNGVTYTFRTTFELPSAKAKLSGGFVADNHVGAIRVNGKAMPVPEHPFSPPEWRPFVFSEGLVKGLNVLEFDVENGAAWESAETGPMALRVELHCAVLSPSERGGGGNQAAAKTPPNATKQETRKPREDKRQ